MCGQADCEMLTWKRILLTTGIGVQPESSRHRYTHTHTLQKLCFCIYTSPALTPISTNFNLQLIWWFPEMGLPPEPSILIEVSHCPWKLSILDIPMAMETPKSFDKWVSSARQLGIISGGMRTWFWENPETCPMLIIWKSFFSTNSGILLLLQSLHVYTSPSGCKGSLTQRPIAESFQHPSGNELCNAKRKASCHCQWPDKATTKLPQRWNLHALI